MLYVVAWPLLGKADDTALRRLRAQYHPDEAGLIGPHFTLVFGAPLDREPELRVALDGIARRPFWFVLERIVRSDTYLFAEPADGAAELRSSSSSTRRSIPSPAASPSSRTSPWDGSAVLPKPRTSLASSSASTCP
ncbi:MAG: hypothetical protein NTV97_20080 [Alphaproteobacteria bacterium]|nr:hypothetical protein [Alphaproteobacteria bacterium]